MTKRVDLMDFLVQTCLFVDQPLIFALQRREVTFLADRLVLMIFLQITKERLELLTKLFLFVALPLEILKDEQKQTGRFGKVNAREITCRTRWRSR